MIEKNTLFNIIDNFSKFKIMVIGDIILDEYIWGKANRLSPEAPVPVLNVNKYSYILGGAANVAHNIQTLGGQVFLAGVVGNDFQAEKLNQILNENNIDTSCIIQAKERPTTVKTRLITHNHQQLARFDKETKESISETTEQIILNKISESINKVDLILLSDYAKGVLTSSLIQEIIKLSKNNNKPILVDPKGLDFTKYTGATLITPNRLEAETATKSSTDTKPEILAQRIKQQLDAEHVLVTLGEDGILIHSKDKNKTIPAVTSEVYDVTGAGDSLISAISLALLATNSDIETTVIIGNYAAGVAVRKIGTTAVTPKELKKIIQLDLLEESTNIV